MSNYCDNNRSPQLISGDQNKKRKDSCPQLPGTILRIFIPKGAVINLLNLIEVTTPSGICLIVRIPLLAKSDDSRILSLDTIKEAVERMGGTIEFVD